MNTSSYVQKIWSFCHTVCNDEWARVTIWSCLLTCCSCNWCANKPRDPATGLPLPVPKGLRRTSLKARYFTVHR